MIKKLTIRSDGNELEFVRVVKQKTGNLLEYIFTKSETKLGMKMTFTEEQLERAMKNKIFF